MTQLTEKPMAEPVSIDCAVLWGQQLARKLFASRGNNSEVHLSELELAAFGALAYKKGLEHGGLTVKVSNP